MVSFSWLYYKIYVGRIFSGIEYLITETQPLILQCEGFDRWFFLRYLDEGGLHLRLRLRAVNSESTLRQAVDPILHQALQTLPSLPPSPYRPTIMSSSLRIGAFPTPVSGHYIRVEVDHYEPEIDKFGKKGISIAEELFETSSDIAMRVLIDERQEKYSRKTLVPILMKAVLDVFVTEGCKVWWEDYVTYWLNAGIMSADEWRPLFMAKARDLRAQDIPVITPDANLPESAFQQVHAWRATLAQAAAAYRVLRDEPAYQPAEMAFHFTHLMNNRLGLLPIEEAYFAALIQQSCSDGYGS